MGVLNKVEEMRKEGMEDNQISQRLMEEGSSPKEIQDAFNREKIKSAVSKENSGYGEMPHEKRENSSSFYTPKTHEVDGEFNQEMYAPEPQEETYYPENYNPEGYGEEYEQGYGESNSTDTMIEIAEQVFSEQIRKIEKKIDNLSEFATLAETKITNNHERLKRIETTFDKLQIAILEKIGSYGKNLDNIKKEMEMMEDSFSKVLPELAKKKSKK